MTKQCKSCLAIKPTTMFYKHKGMVDGLLNNCKDCVKARVSKHRKENIDKIRAYDRDRGNRQSKDYLRGYREKYPNKYKAHNLVNNRLRSGDLIKGTCEVCGCSEVHGHHDDYSKPLEVRWLCPEHHKQWHEENGEGLNG